MGATTVTATILGVDNQPIVGAYTYFRLTSVGTDSVATSRPSNVELVVIAPVIAPPVFGRAASAYQSFTPIHRIAQNARYGG